VPEAAGRPPASPRRSSRAAGRGTAVEILYQADVTGRPPSEVLREWDGAGRTVSRFARELVEGVDRRRTAIDAVLESHAEGWTVARMPSLDRAILRVAVHELLDRTDVPVGVAISEAVEAAAELSTQDSGRFVNGILGRIAREAPRTA
jgi:N utilization substance protein B